MFHEVNFICVYLDLRSPLVDPDLVDVLLDVFLHLRGEIWLQEFEGFPVHAGEAGDARETWK